MLWKDHTSLSMPSYSLIRWWSRWKLYKQLMIKFGNIEEFLKHSDVSSVTKTNLLSFFSGSSQETTVIKYESTSGCFQSG